MTKLQTLDSDHKAPAILPVYRRSNITMVKGEGCYLFDETGKKYLDFATGIAVNALGHCHPHVTAALKNQADKLWLCSNLYMHPELKKLADRLVANTFADSVFFSSSGTEAVEAAIKFARRTQHMQGKPHKKRIITFSGGFHGRSITAISAGGNDKAREGYAPLLEGFDRAEFNNIESVKALIQENTGAILLEAIQGEGGVVEASKEFLIGLRQLCDANDLLLIFDEVQCGMCRSGAMFAFEYAGIEPDITTVAKGIGNGFPLAATLVKVHIAEAMTPGSHGSTYGANPLAMAVGNAVLDEMLKPEFLLHVRQMGEQLKSSLEEIAKKFPKMLSGVRGRGLMLGLQLQPQSALDHYQLAEKLRHAGLLTAPAVEGRVIRILPPLIIDGTHINEAIAILKHTLESDI